MNKFKQSSWIITVPLVAAALAYMMLVFLPGMKAIAQITEQVRTKQEYLAQADKLRPLLDQVTRSLAETETYNSQWMTRTIEAEKLPILFGQISELAKASGATITRFEPQPGVKYKSMHRVPLALAIGGDFNSIQVFLKSLEELPAAIWVEDLKLSGGGQDGKNIVCEMILAIFTGNSEKSD